MSLTDSRFIERLNQVQEELYLEGDFPNVIDRWHLLFDEVSGELVLPYYLDRLMQVTVDRVPATIVSPWAEFVAYGTGTRDDLIFADSPANFSPRCWYSDCLDRGEVVTRFPIPVADGPWVIRAYLQRDEDVAGESPVINLQGWKDDRLIRSEVDGEFIDGVNLELDYAQPFTVTTQEFDRLTAIVKPSTRGYVKLFAWNGVTEVPLSDLAPSETAPSYRNYFIESLYRPVQGIRNRVVLARARRRFVPVANDNDLLIISNINALKCGMIALWKRDAGDYEAYAFQKAQAVDILNKEAMGYRGKARTPAISYTRGFPIGDMPYVR